MRSQWTPRYGQAHGPLQSKVQKSNCPGMTTSPPGDAGYSSWPSTSYLWLDYTTVCQGEPWFSPCYGHLVWALFRLLESPRVLTDFGPTILTRQSGQCVSCWPFSKRLVFSTVFGTGSATTVFTTSTRTPMLTPITPPVDSSSLTLAGV
uniref:Uncharacterized protein n=1 Tax=Cacopsylla melanoneura TaxID=428564 RepID=A0A8D8QYA9_9HEMI